jgi:hypothetical protein
MVLSSSYNDTKRLRIAIEAEPGYLRNTAVSYVTERAAA